MIRVLVVEDDPMVSKINKNYIESVKGFKVIGACKDEVETLNFLKNNQVDLVILDLYLPRGDGISILNKIRNLGYLADIIMVTASSDSKNIDKALRLGVIDYLIKPFEYERLKRSLEKYLYKKELINKDQISQKDIDKITEKNINSDLTLEKGLNKYTLESIISFLEKSHRDKFSSEEISTELDISKVTVRKYMAYLEKTNYIVKEVEYGGIGRPMHYYRKVR